MSHAIADFVCDELEADWVTARGALESLLLSLGVTDNGYHQTMLSTQRRVPEA
jgi:hypothetical protein